jgi:hypothetical protein
MNSHFSFIPFLLLNGDHPIFVCQMQHMWKHLLIIFHRNSFQVRKQVMGSWVFWSNTTQVSSVILISKFCPQFYCVLGIVVYDFMHFLEGNLALGILQLFIGKILEFTRSHF